MKKLLFPLFFFFLIASVSCNKIKKSDAEYEREAWIESFTDSIGYYQMKTSEIEKKLENINHRIAPMLENFEKINNPREVTGYYLLKGWNKRLPMTSTGIYARINENEKLELIATLAGNTFNRIETGDKDETISSEVVPHDQAFNFRHERFNTVYFSGNKADSIARFIAMHSGEKINLKFIEGSKVNNFTVPADEKEMIKDTWHLYSSQLEARQLQKELWLCSHKINAFRRVQQSANPTE